MRQRPAKRLCAVLTRISATALLRRLSLWLGLMMLNPLHKSKWIPAFAGMTSGVVRLQPILQLFTKPWNLNLNFNHRHRILRHNTISRH